MSRNYDNWEKLVSAVIKRKEIWELCHQPSRTPSICSEASSSDFSSSFQLSDVNLVNNEESVQKPVPRLVPFNDVLKRTRGLGKGRFGTSILIQLQRDVRVSDQEFLAEGTQLVMKKWRTTVLKVTDEEFETVFGNFRHENVAAPRAYYFSTNGNFIFNDYHSQGSVYDLLHVDVPSLNGTSIGRRNWESRLKIAIGAARGIAHIHGQCGGKFAHGNIKSSNIFLNSEQYGCVSDFGLAGIMIRPGKWAIIRPHSLEYNLKNVSQESDVFNFGVVLLQLLTGYSPMERRAGFWRNVHIVEWALSMRSEYWNSKLFDQSLWSSDLSSYHGYVGGLPLCDELDMFEYESSLEEVRKIKDEMVEMMQMATRCLATLPQDRPKMSEVVLNLDNIFNTPLPRITTKLNCCLLKHY